MSTKLIDMSKQLRTFLVSSEQSVHLKETNGISGISIIEAHLQKRRLEADRFGMHVLSESSGEGFNCLNMVNVAVAEKNRRKGLFADFLELLERFDYGCCLNKGSDFHIRIDQVMNPVLDDFLPKRGYARVRSGYEAHFSYFKRIRRREVPEGKTTAQSAHDGPEGVVLLIAGDREGIFVPDTGGF